jgi:hypothetical protein
MVARYNVDGSRMPKFFQGMRNRFRNRVGKSRYRKTINFDDDEISLDQSGGDDVALESAGHGKGEELRPRVFDGAVEVSKGGAADDGHSDDDADASFFTQSVKTAVDGSFCSDYYCGAAAAAASDAALALLVVSQNMSRAARASSMVKKSPNFTCLLVTSTLKCDSPKR